MLTVIIFVTRARNWFVFPGAKYNFLIICSTVWLIEKETGAAQLLWTFYFKQKEKNFFIF